MFEVKKHTESNIWEINLANIPRYDLFVDVCLATVESIECRHKYTNTAYAQCRKDYHQGKGIRKLSSDFIHMKAASCLFCPNSIRKVTNTFMTLTSSPSPFKPWVFSSHVEVLQSQWGSTPRMYTESQVHFRRQVEFIYTMYWKVKMHLYFINIL